MPQIIVLVLTTILLGLMFNPVALINGYFLFRPLVHPFAIEQLKLLSLPINWPFTAVIVIGVVLSAFMRKGFRLFPYNIIPLYLLTFLSVLSLAFSINPVVSIGQSIKFISAVSIVLLVSNVANSKKNIINIYRGIVFSSVIPMLYGYYQYFTGSGHVVLGEHTQRITSFFGFANLYGIFLALIIFSAAILYFESESRMWKRIYIGILVSAVVSSILALNRGTWIAMTLALFLSYPFYSKYLKLRYFVMAFSIIAIAAAGIVINRFLELGEQRIGADTLGGRMQLWFMILNSFTEIPLLGYGAGTAQEALTRLYGISQVPHNDYLRLLVELGLLGPVIYISLLFREFLGNIRLRRSSSAWHVNYFTLAMVFYWGIISFAQNIYHDVVVFPIFFACCHLARQYNKHVAE